MKKKYLLPWLTALPLALFSGCYPAGGLKHLAYQVSLVEGGQTSETELVAVLGEPSEIKETSDIEKIMLFRDLRRSRGKRVPILAGFIGHETIDTVTCTLKNRIVEQCDYEEKVR